MNDNIALFGFGHASWVIFLISGTSYIWNYVVQTQF